MADSAALRALARRVATGASSAQDALGLSPAAGRSLTRRRRANSSRAAAAGGDQNKGSFWLKVFAFGGGLVLLFRASKLFLDKEKEGRRLEQENKSLEAESRELDEELAGLQRKIFPWY